jgi:hypothetical protein
VKCCDHKRLYIAIDKQIKIELQDARRSDTRTEGG